MNLLQRGLVWILGLVAAFNPLVSLGQSEPLKVAVLKHSPPMSFRNELGELTGFNVEVGQLLCAQMKVKCQIVETVLDQVIDELATAKIDFAVASLLETPERINRVLFTRPYYRSTSYWLIKGTVSTPPRQSKVAVVSGSKQAEYLHANKDKWDTIEVRTNLDLQRALMEGTAAAALVPMGTAVDLFNAKSVRAQGFRLIPVEAESLRGAAKIAVTPSKPKLRDELDKALLEMANGSQFERINSKYFPFRIY